MDNLDAPRRLSVDDAVDVFSSDGASIPERKQALSVLIAEKYLPKNVDTNGVERGVWRLVEAAKEHASQEQLLAIAEVVRFRQVVKARGASLAAQLEPAFVQPLPLASTLADADDRLNLARACRDAPQVDWLPAWLAQAVMEEEAGEKARAEMLQVLVDRSETLADVLRLLASAAEAIHPTTEAPGDTMARRLVRVLNAWRSVLTDCDLPAGDDLGEALHDLLMLPLTNTGKPTTDKVQKELCEEVFLVVHDSVRTRISLVADPAVYKVVAYCKRMFDGRTWPKSLEKVLGKLTADVSEALVLLGRQGRKDQALLDQLEVLSGSRDAARQTARKLAKQNAQLPEDVRNWLTNGRDVEAQQASESAKAAEASNADGTLGQALMLARRLQSAGQGLREPLLDAINAHDASLAPHTDRFLQLLNALSVLIEQAGSLRNLALLGEAGEEVDVDPKFFDIAGTPLQRMRVRMPAVVRLRDDRSVGEVVVRGTLG